LNCTSFANNYYALNNDISEGHVVKNCVGFGGKTKNYSITSNSTQVNNSWNLTTLTADSSDFVVLSEDSAAAARQPDGSLPNNGFGRLVRGSDLIDKGVDVGLPYSGSAPDLGAFEYAASTAVDPSEETSVPSAVLLFQNYPNPFNPATKIRYSVHVRSAVKISVYNLLGQQVAVLVQGMKAPGTYTAIWNASAMPSGVYYCRLQAEQTMQMKKMMVLK